MNYDAFGKLSTSLLKVFGVPVKITRPDGSSVGKTHAMFTSDDETLDSAQGLQTVVTSRTLLVAPMKKELLVGDLLSTKKEKYVINEIHVTKPTDTAILYKCKVSYGD
jgi:hypothetical protein